MEGLLGWSGKWMCCKGRQNWPAFLSWQAEGDNACLCLPLSLSIDKGKELFKL